MTTPPADPPRPLDRGEADPHVRAALATAYEGGDAYARAVAALCTARLILPPVEAPACAEAGRSKRVGGTDHDHGLTDVRGAEGPASSSLQRAAVDRERHPEMAAVLVHSAAGEKGVAVFTGYDSLRAWRPDAHPVRCTLDDVAATALETEASAIIVDLPGPHPVVIERVLIDELAQGRRLVELPDGSFGWMWAADVSA